MKRKRELVVPGELLDDSGKLRPGHNTYREGGKVYASRLGLKDVRGDRVSVITLSGRYEPQRGDFVIGTIVEAGPSNWYINIGAAHDVGMHVNDVPWRVEFGETSRYLDIGDSVLLKIYHVDELRRVQVSMKDRQCRKLQGGLVLEVAPVKVPRIIGRGGSMIQQIKEATNTRLLVGQNGIIWIDGEPEEVAIAVEAIRKVEAESHTSGLTDRMKAWLQERTKTLQREPEPAEAEEGGPEAAIAQEVTVPEDPDASPASPVGGHAVKPGEAAKEDEEAPAESAEPTETPAETAEEAPAQDAGETDEAEAEPQEAGEAESQKEA